MNKCFSSYLVLVYKESTDKNRKRSSTDPGCSKDYVQHDYSQSQKMGTSCYTTAELPASLVGDEYILNIGDDKMYGRYHNVPLQQGTTYQIYVAVKVELPVGAL